MMNAKKLVLRNSFTNNKRAKAVVNFLFYKMFIIFYEKNAYDSFGSFFLSENNQCHFEV